MCATKADYSNGDLKPYLTCRMQFKDYKAKVPHNEFDDCVNALFNFFVWMHKEVVSGLRFFLCFGDLMQFIKLFCKNSLIFSAQFEVEVNSSKDFAVFIIFFKCYLTLLFC